MQKLTVIKIGKTIETGDPNNVNAASNNIHIGDNIGGGYGNNMIKIGANIPAKGFNYDQIFIGDCSVIGGRQNTIIGWGTPNANGDSGVAVGYNTIVENKSTALGYNANANASDAIALGYNTVANAANAVAIGSGVTASVANYTTTKNLQLTNYAALNFANDTEAAGGGVPLGGIYHNLGALRIRTT